MDTDTTEIKNRNSADPKLRSGDDVPIELFYQPDDYHLVIVPVAGMLSSEYDIVRKEDYEAGLIIPAYRFRRAEWSSSSRTATIRMADPDGDEMGLSHLETRREGSFSTFERNRMRICEILLNNITSGGEGPVEQATFPAHPEWRLLYTHTFPHWRLFEGEKPMVFCGTFALHRSLFLPTTRRGLAVTMEIYDVKHYLDLVGSVFALYRAFLLMTT